MGYSVAETEEVKQVPVLSIVEQNGIGSVENLNKDNSFTNNE